MLALAFVLALHAPQVRAPERAQEPAAAPLAREDLEAALDGVRADLRRRRWKSASKGLVEALARFEGSEVARGKRIEIEELARQSSFWSEHAEPAPRELIGGDLMQHYRAADLVRIQYSAGRRSTRPKARSERPKVSVPLLHDTVASPAPPPFPDFEVDGFLTVHPLQWNGPYTAELRAKPPGLMVVAPVLVFVLDASDLLIATLGDECVLRRVRDGVEEVLVRSAGARWREKQAYRIQAQVGDASVSILLDGRNVLMGPKPRGTFGWFGFAFVEGIETVSIGGKSYGQWLDALVDAAVEADRAAFDGRWNARERLPAWLFETRAPAPRDAAAEKAAIDLVQGGIRDAEIARQWVELAGRDDLDALRTLVDGVPRDAVTAVTHAWMKSLVYTRLEWPDVARRFADEVCAAAPSHRATRILAALLSAQLDPPETSVAKLRALAHDFPDDARGRESLVRVLLRSGDLAGAAREAELALAQGLDPAVVEPLVRRTHRALAGPAWRATQRFASAHYEVASDMDRETCVQIAGVLEESLALFSKQIGPLPERGQRMRAFVFSGKQAYFDYCSDLVGDPMSRTQGMYSPELAQLLLWNAQDRADFLDTARHEAFHQYVHALVPEIPVWLDEGLAQYFQTARREKGKTVLGGVPSGYAEALKNVGKWPRIDRILEVQRDDFYGKDAQGWYAVSWCVVHALAHGAPEDRRVFDALLGKLAQGTQGSVAVRDAFEGVDRDALLERVKAHAARL